MLIKPSFGAVGESCYASTMAAIRLGALLQLPSWFVRGVIATCLGSTLGCSGEEEAPVEPKQSFTWAILADTHITESTERKARLERAVAWLNEQGSAEQIELVFVVGDVGGARGSLRRRVCSTS